MIASKLESTPDRRARLPGGGEPRARVVHTLEPRAITSPFPPPMDPLQTTRTRNGVLYAAEWPCCHDPLRLCPLFHDLLPWPPHGCASATTPHFEIVASLPSCSSAWPAAHLGSMHSMFDEGRRTEPSQSALVRAATTRCVSVLPTRRTPPSPLSHPNRRSLARPRASYTFDASASLRGAEACPPPACCCIRLRSAPGEDQGPNTTFIALLCFSTVGFHGSFRFATWTSASFGSLVTFALFWKWWSLCKPLGHLGPKQWERGGILERVLGSSERPHVMPWARAHVPRVLSADSWPQNCQIRQRWLVWGRPRATAQSVDRRACPRMIQHARCGSLARASDARQD